MVWLPSSLVRGGPCDLRLYHVCQGPGAAAWVIEPCALRLNAPSSSQGPVPGDSVLGSRFISVLDKKRF